MTFCDHINSKFSQAVRSKMFALRSFRFWKETKQNPYSFTYRKKYTPEELLEGVTQWGSLPIWTQGQCWSGCSGTNEVTPCHPGDEGEPAWSCSLLRCPPRRLPLGAYLRAFSGMYNAPFRIPRGIAPSIWHHRWCLQETLETAWAGGMGWHGRESMAPAKEAGKVPRHAGSGHAASLPGWGLLGATGAGWETPWKVLQHHTRLDQSNPTFNLHISLVGDI